MNTIAEGANVADKETDPVLLLLRKIRGLTDDVIRMVEDEKEARHDGSGQAGHPGTASGGH